MGLFDIFKNVTTKFTSKGQAKLPEAQFINSATADKAFIHENAYIEAYTKQLNTKPSNIICLEDNGKIIKSKSSFVMFLKMVQIVASLQARLSVHIPERSCTDSKRCCIFR